MATARNYPSPTFDPTTLPKPLEGTTVVDVPEVVPVPTSPLGDRASIVAWLRAHRTAESVDHEHWRKKLADDIAAEKDRQ